jgi:hypothetical protein
MAKKTYDLDKIDEAYSTARIRGQAERHAYERNWFRNILFFLGVQWIQYLPNSRLWLPRNLKKWVPRPVTNKFASHAVSIIQVLCSKTPEISCRPGSESPEDVATADVANRALEVILKEAGAKESRKLIAAWTTLTGTAFILPVMTTTLPMGLRLSDIFSAMNAARRSRRTKLERALESLIRFAHLQVNRSKM